MSMAYQFASVDDLPVIVPVFPLTAALLLPRGTMPLNIFEPRYVSMIDDALKGHRMIGIIQPRDALKDDQTPESPVDAAALCDVGCLGRITGLQETDDGRYLITLFGIGRFRLVDELETTTPYRQCRISTADFENDLDPCRGEDVVDRDKLLETFRAYLDANDLEADWPSVQEANTESLVNVLSMMSPYGAREKQALLEAADLKARSEMLIALTEMVLQLSAGATESLQ